KIAIHLGQWLSPEFAVFVTELVFDWQQKAIEPPKVARIAQEKPKKEKIEPVEQVWPERETVLSEQQLASLQENIAMSVENCWPRGGVVRTVGEYCTAVAKHFGVFSYQDILQTDYAAAIGFVVGYANCKSNQQKDIILRVFDGRKDLTDAEMFERSLADVVGQAMNLVRERPVKRGLLG
ncbi:MAG: hypothetical protein COC24_019270, partial [Alphaproteobacteria bacterium]|nr:hypothetical protein [Alphaproteobacteria bacterium]